MAGEQKLESKLNYIQLTGDFKYEVPELDLNSLVRNLKTDTIELKEKIFIDKPLQKQREVPFESKYGVN